MSEVHRPQIRLVEVLVVIACTGVLIGIFLPVISYPGRTARPRSICQNNLRQFVMAAMNFESTAQKLPAIRQIRTSASGPQTVGWVYDLLPYIEAQPTYDLLKRDPKDATANETKFSLMSCPSDPTIERPTDVSYMANGGCPNRAFDNFDSAYNGVGDDLAGSYVPRQRATSKDCKDGTTQTLFYVENCNAQRWNEDFYHPPGESREYYHAVNWLPVVEADLEKVFQDAKPKSKARFLWGINSGPLTESGPEFARPSSYHPGGFQAAFVGGNVRYVRESIDYRVYAQLLSGLGARTVDPADTSEGRTEAIRAWQAINLAPQSYE